MFEGFILVQGIFGGVSLQARGFLWGVICAPFAPPRHLSIRTGQIDARERRVLTSNRFLIAQMSFFLGGNITLCFIERKMELIMKDTCSP